MKNQCTKRRACPIQCDMDIMSCLPQKIALVLKKYKNIQEIRIRNNSYVRASVDGIWYYVGENSLVASYLKAVVIGNECEQIISKACNNSLYSYEASLSEGFFVMEDGTRVGVCGSVSSNHGYISYTSLCFRIPHSISVIKNEDIDNLCKDSFVVIGPPCSGKTTFLKHFIQLIENKYNVLVVDERGELVANRPSNCDCLKYSKKQYAFDVGVRAMSPDWIIFDELLPNESVHVNNIKASGVKIACSCHGNCYQDFVKITGINDGFRKCVILGERYKKYSIDDIK